jgi:succinyldiaminopimelate transaminase
LELRQAWVSWARRILSADLTTDQVVPSIGSKEIVAWLPIVFGLNQNSTVAIPELAYPTYAVGALLAHAKFVTYKQASDIPDNTDMIWVNSPGNPTGEVLTANQLKEIVARGRELSAPVVSDECYIELGWEAEPISILDPRVCGTDFTGILAVHSLSKRSNLAGYRSGAVLGDAKLISDIVSLRKHAGMLVSTPVQLATVAALSDDAHVVLQKARYAKRRDVLHTALISAGFKIEHSQAGLYLWATNGSNCLETVNWLAEKGILAAPGDFYGPAGNNHVRLALTATDERIDSAAARLTSN